MISQKPILGYGENGFKNHYMTFQEQYFAKHHNSPYKDLADNITHPFNEYLLILTNYGILGLSILLIVILSIYI